MLEGDFLRDQLHAITVVAACEFGFLKASTTPWLENLTTKDNECMAISLMILVATTGRVGIAMRGVQGTTISNCVCICVYVIDSHGPVSFDRGG